MGRTASSHHVLRQRLRPISGPDQKWNDRRIAALSMPLLLIIAGWSYWPVIMDLFQIWQGNEDYSAGGLVPLVVAFLLWRDRKAILQSPLVPFWAGGAALVILAEMGRTYGFLSLRPSVGHYALVLTVVGLVLMVSGWQVFRRILWILLFLVLMVPLPGAVRNTVSGPLQSVATTGSVFLLQAFGVSAFQQENVINLPGGTPLEVAQACSGLRMLMAFIIVAAFIAYMVRRPRWQKGVLFLSSIPVAVVCNVVRIFVTGLLVLHVGAEAAEKFFHDFAGLIMMPFAVMLLFGVIWVMDKIVVPESKGSPPRRPTPARPQVIVSKRLWRKDAHLPASGTKIVPGVPPSKITRARTPDRSMSPYGSAIMQVHVDQVVTDELIVEGAKQSRGGGFQSNSP